MNDFLAYSISRIRLDWCGQWASTVQRRWPSRTLPASTLDLVLRHLHARQRAKRYNFEKLVVADGRSPGVLASRRPHAPPSRDAAAATCVSFECGKCASASHPASYPTIPFPFYPQPKLEPVYQVYMYVLSVLASIMRNDKLTRCLHAAKSTFYYPGRWMGCVLFGIQHGARKQDLKKLTRPEISGINVTIKRRLKQDCFMTKREILIRELGFNLM